MLVATIFVAIVISLGSAMWFLVKDKGGSDRMARGLTIRIGLSVALFILLYVLNLAGVIQPHGL
jgi:hypothetical protein